MVMKLYRDARIGGNKPSDYLISGHFQADNERRALLLVGNRPCKAIYSQRGLAMAV